MDGSGDRQLLSGVWATSAGTLVSRVLGVVRDVVTASLLGLGQGGVMDALVVALRIPNFTRRFFGEGALAASLIPALAAQRENSPRRAWRLLSMLLVLLSGLLAVIVVAGEVALLGYWWCSGERDTLLTLTAVTLPYLVFICLAAQVAAALQSCGRFRAAALAPSLLNVCWLAAAWLIAPLWTGDREAQALVLALAILVSGAAQLAVLLAALRTAGFRFEFDLRGTWPAIRNLTRASVPIALGLGVTQITTLVDSLLAVALAVPQAQQPITWLGGVVNYPLKTGAAAAIYYGERFYQLPVGVLGLAIATVLYPRLARHAAGGDRRRVGEDLTAGLRLVWFTALPAGIGMLLLAEPIVRVLFVRGEFTAHDGQRAAAMIACYASAAWAYCAVPLLARACYALGERRLPLLAGMIAVAFDLLTTLVLLWPVGERGLAISTALAAAVQVVVLCRLVRQLDIAIGWPRLSATLVRGALATAAMAIVVIALRGTMLTDGGGQAWRLATVIVLGVLTYLGTAWILGMSELELLGARFHARQSAAVARRWAPQAMISRIGRP